jgi:nucleoside-diphosphate-sugar epimerase
MQVLVTGSNGFIGSRLLERLAADGSWQVRAASRGKSARVPAGIRAVSHGNLSAAADWREAVADANVVIHLAARVHVMKDSAGDPLSEFRRINVQASARLAEQAAAAGVRRFVYVSSIKVNGESTSAERPFRPDDAPHPQDPYGISKWEAERELRSIAANSGMEVVVVRPPLVYGPGVGANFRSLMRWLHRGLPLPFGAIDNRRSLVALDNLCDLLIACASHPAAAGQTFLASDGEDISTTHLLERLGRALGRPARLVPLPAGILWLAFAAIGKKNVGTRLCQSLCVDSETARTRLGWRPTISLDEGLRRTANAYLAEYARH